MGHAPSCLTSSSTAIAAAHCKILTRRQGGSYSASSEQIPKPVLAFWVGMEQGAEMFSGGGLE